MHERKKRDSTVIQFESHETKFTAIKLLCFVLSPLVAGHLCIIYPGPAPRLVPEPVPAVTGSEVGCSTYNTGQLVTGQQEQSRMCTYEEMGPDTSSVSK